MISTELEQPGSGIKTTLLTGILAVVIIFLVLATVFIGICAIFKIKLKGKP